MIKKCLKGLCMLGLIILPISFSSAVNYVENVGDYEDLGSNNNCTVNSDLSFNCSESDNVIVGTDTAWYKTSSSYFWTNSGLAMYIHVQNGNDYQGLITSFIICGSDNVGSCNTQISYQDFLTYASNYELTQWRWYSNSSTPGWAGIDFIFGSTHIYFGPSSTNNGELITYGNYTPYNFGLNGWGLEANYSDVIDTPFDTPIDLPDYTINPSKPITNQDALEGCIYVGLDLPYCFGGFDIDNIFQPGEDYEAFTGYHFGSGAAIWTLYDLYSGAYSTPKNFMGSLRSAYINKQFNRFYTEPKALFMIVHQYYSMYDRGQINFQWLDVWDFCDLTHRLAVGDLQLDDEYTGGNNTCTNGYISKKTNESQGSFQLSGFLNSGSGGVSSADEFFGRLTNLMNDNISRFEGEFDPIIPSYIIVFMLAIILIRLISH